MSLDSVLAKRLEHLAKRGLRRRERVLAPAAEPLAVLCANDYLGVADPANTHGRTAAGIGAGASRLVSGTRAEHLALEAELADWLRTPACLLFNTGYHANVGLVSALLEPGDAVFSDALNHASIIDGVRLSRARRTVYPHGDVDRLARALKMADDPGLKVVITESVFSMDGDLAPLERIVDVARSHGAVVVVDEAHAIGVLGDEGRGACEAVGIEKQVDIRVGTCSKAIGGMGGFVAGSELLRELLFNRARPFVFTTALPTSVVESNRRGLAEIRAGDRQARLWERIAYATGRLAEIGWWRGEPSSAIIPLIVGEASIATALSERLAERGFFVQAIRPPTVPEGTSRLRLTLSAAYSTARIDRFIDTFADVVEALGVPPHSASHGQAGRT